VTDHLYLVGDTRLPPPFQLVRRSHASKPSRIFCRPLFTRSSPKPYKWMRVYDYVDAQEHAEMWMEI